jgi:hypothetical protein
MVVANGEDGSIAEYSLFDDEANVDADLADASTGNEHLLDETVVLIHEQQPELFDVFIL